MYSRRGGTKLSYRADDSSWRDTHPYTARLTFSSYARHTPLSRISHLKQMWDTTLWVCPSSVKSETHVIEVCLQFGVGALNISGPHALSQHLANFQNTHLRSCPILDVDPGACCHLDLGPGACHRLHPSPKHAAASTPALQHIVISNLIDSLELNLNSNNFFSDSIAAPRPPSTQNAAARYRCPPTLYLLLRLIDWQISEDLFMIDWQFIWHY
jgi:hypothetical protein